MSRKLSVLLFSILAIIYHSKVYPIDNYKVNQRLNVLASSLNMRNSPSIKAKIIRSIPYGARVRVLSKTRNRYLSNGIKGYWVEVLYKNKAGYIFDGYLTRFPVPHKTCKSLKQYVNKGFTKIDNKPIKIIDPYKSTDSHYSKYMQRYKGAKLIVEEGYEYGYEILIIKGISLEEAYLIAKLSYSNSILYINKAIKKSSFSLNSKGEVYIKAGINGTQSVKIRKNSKGYTYIIFEYGA